MNWKACITISLLVLTLSGCANWKKVLPYQPAEIVEVPIYRYPDCGHPPKRTPVEFRDPNWEIYPNPKGEQGWWLSPQGYEDAAFNLDEMRMASKELKAEIAYYLNCLKPPVAE